MHELNFLPVILVLLLTAVIVVAIFRRLRMSPVLGYFAAGSILGSPFVNIVQADETSVFGEIGIIFLLFAIGLELTFARLKSMRSQVFGFGSLQVILTTAVISGFIVMGGYAIDASVVIGMAMAFSSTAIVLQVLAENRMQSTQVGRISLATLLMQDFAVVPLLVLIPLLAADKYSIMTALGSALFKAILALVGIFTIGRIFLRPLFRMIGGDNSAKNNELFIAATLLIALGAAWATERMGLSLALGAFLAGLLVAETEFQHQAEESITPFKGIFLGLFFMSVGMSINFDLIVEKLPKILLFTGVLITTKAFIITLLCLLFGFTVGSAIHAGLLLSQGSEFAFILFNLANSKNIIQHDLAATLMLVITFSMALTPLLSTLGGWLAEKIDKKDLINRRKILKELADISNHVIICGFGRVGKMVARLLEAEHVPYVSVDVDGKCVSDSRDEGYPVYFGDSSNPDILQTLGLGRAQAVIIAITNDITMRKTVKTIRNISEDVPIIVRDSDLSAQSQLLAIGANSVVPETYETGLQLGGAVLKTIGVSEYEVSRIKNKFRAGNYQQAIDLKENEEEEEAVTDN